MAHLWSHVAARSTGLVCRSAPSRNPGTDFHRPAAPRGSVFVLSVSTVAAPGTAAAMIGSSAAPDCFVSAAGGAADWPQPQPATTRQANRIEREVHLEPGTDCGLHPCH